VSELKIIFVKSFEKVINLILEDFLKAEDVSLLGSDAL
jgi:hypothetical protein